MPDKLHTIRLADYSNMGGVYTKWKYSSREVPDYFLRNFQDLPSHLSVFQLLMRIRKVLYDFYGEKPNYASTFAESRFTSISEILERKLISCGAVTCVFGLTLREFGIPTKFVHGKIKGTRPNDRHAWLKVYDPNDKKWIEIDPGTNDFSVYSDARQWRIYYNWNELKKDYEKGNF